MGTITSEVSVNPTCVELFAGAGGASVGLHQAGFKSLLAVEWDTDAHATLEAAGLSMKTVCGDVRDMTLYSGLEGGVDLLWASPPCQVWSIVGNRRGALDDRNGWPWTLNVVDKLQPKWVLCENVTGLLNHQSNCQVAARKVRTGEALELFQDDVDEGQLGLPPAEDCPGCYWARVVLPEFQNRYAFVAWKVLNAANYGVPQRRERVILLAGPEAVPWPEETHSMEALSYAKWIDESYWARHGIPKASRWSPVEKTASQHKRRGAPWVTIRDVFSTLPPYPAGYAELLVEPQQFARMTAFRNMADVTMNPDLPAHTVTCRRGGSKTNDALILNDGGQLRYLTIPELAALQAFPLDHPWQGSNSAKYKQVGNAVPPPMAEVLGRVIAEKLAR